MGIRALRSFLTTDDKNRPRYIGCRDVYGGAEADALLAAHPDQFETWPGGVSDSDNLRIGLIPVNAAGASPPTSDSDRKPSPSEPAPVRWSRRLRHRDRR
jgi:hypothetical protein